MYGNQDKPRQAVRVSTLAKMKAEGEKIAVITAYDASFAALVDQAGVDVVLVGDSLGNVIQGQATTIPVSVDDMVYHTQCVSRGLNAPFLVADLPFMSYATVDKALASSARLMKEGGAHMVKLEGGAEVAPIVAELTKNGVPVCGHVGLLPQSVHKMGGYKVQGKDQAAADKMIADAQALEQAGADLMVVECIPADLGKRLSESLSIPLIGIGAGVDCDGQVLVLHDMLGITLGKSPKFSKNFMLESGSVPEALAAYVTAVKEQTFPAQEHCF